jgi:hypothetical protein
MRYGLKPEDLLERLALLAGKIPVPIIDSMLPVIQARALICAARAGVFDAMRAPGDHRPADVARLCGVEEDCLELILRVLIPPGYIVQGRRGYHLSKMARSSLARGGDSPCAGFVEFGAVQWRVIERMDEVLKTGQSLDLHHTFEGDRDWEVYQRAMLDLARLAAPVLAAKVPVPRGARRIVDLGGSHGYLGAAICRKHPPMKSEVYDLEPAVKHARRLAAEAGIADIVEHRVADLAEVELGAGVDVALLANIVHHFTPEMNLGILRRVRAAMSPRGVVAIWDMVQPSRSAPAELGAEAASLLFRISSNSRAFTAEEYTGWLSQSGFQRIRTIRSPTAPGQVLVVAHT